MGCLTHTYQRSQGRELLGAARPLNSAEAAPDSDCKFSRCSLSGFIGAELPDPPQAGLESSISEGHSPRYLW